MILLFKYQRMTRHEKRNIVVEHEKQIYKFKNTSKLVYGQTFEKKVFLGMLAKLFNTK